MTTENASRKLPSWTDGFLEYTEGFATPLLFRKWAAIACVAGVMERKVYAQVTNAPLYPNLYTFLVGPPGVGKTVLTDIVGALWRGISGLNVAPTSITDAALIDSLAEASRRVILPRAQGFLDFNSLLIASNELSVLLPAYDGGMMSILTDLYDCKIFEQRRRGNKLHIKLPCPQLNILAATTPSYLNDFLPPGAWDQGFISRTIIIFSGEKTIVPLFSVVEKDNPLWLGLVNDLKIIADLKGKMTFTEEAAKALQHWHMAGGPPAPEHGKLLHYNSRRTAHLIKLCLVASAARSDELLITLEDYQTALSWLLEAESFMPEIFKAMSSGTDGRIMEDTWHYVYTIYAKEKKPIPEHRIVHFMAQKVPVYAVHTMLVTMVRANMLEIVAADSRGRPLYQPTPKVTHG